MPKNKNKILSIEIFIDNNSKRTIEQREEFFKGYINQIEGCSVISTSIENAERI